MASKNSTDDNPSVAGPQTAPQSNLPVYPKLSLQLEEDRLIAYLHPAKETQCVTEVQLQLDINRHNLSELQFDHGAMRNLLKQAKTNNAYSIPIAIKVDAALVIKTSNNKLFAYAEHVPARGGLLLDEARIKSAFEAAKISPECIDESCLPIIVGETRHFSLVIAKGRAAANGDNAKFLPLIKKRKSIIPSSNVKDNVNYFDAELYPNVLEGDRLMKRSPATDGVDGVDVFGKILKSKKGKDTKFKKQKGTAIDPENENILLATQKGHPVVSALGVKVDDVLVLPNADLQTGNVIFDGSVMISGNVMPLVKIDVTGDIHVKGTVENATLKAGNNIVVGGGVISESAPDIEDPPKITTVLDAGNDIHAMFINLTDMRAGNDIVIQKYVMHSDIFAKHDILVGDRGGKGAIICGNTESGHCIKANYIGSGAYLKTTVTCGAVKMLLSEKKALDKRLKQRTNEHDQLIAIREKVAAIDGTEKVGSVLLQKKAKIDAAIEALVKRLGELDLIEAALAIQITNALDASIEAGKKVFPKTLININDNSQLVTIEKRKCKIYCQDGCIKFE